MKVEKIHSIDDLFQRVKDFDLVLTADAPLSDALNSKLNEPILGKFAETPRRLALKQNSDLKKKRELFIHLVQETNQSWKRISYILNNIIDCWQTTGDLHGILEYEEFNNTQVQEIINVIENTNNVYSAIEEYNIPETKSIAVIGLHQFNELDKKILPPKDHYTKINSFKNQKTNLPKFKLFKSTNKILKTLESNITKKNANEIAIVISKESKYKSAMKSKLEAQEIPYMTPKKLNEKNNLRTLLSLIRYSFASNRLRLKDVQPILRNINKTISIKHNNQFLTDLDKEKLSEFKSITKKITKSKYNFRELIKIFEELTDQKLREIKKHLDEINILDRSVNEENLNKLEYYLDSFDIQLDSTDGGVLIADPKTVSYIDRPIVFHLGMDSNWTHKIPEKPWINDQKNLKNFKILLQNGEQQHYLVQNKQMNEKVTPSFYFNEILNQEFNQFEDLSHDKYQEVKEKREKQFQKEEYDVEVEKKENISQTDLKRFYQCPRQYLFSKLVDDVEYHYTKRGSLFHDLAEFYYNFPDIVEENEEEIKDLMIQEMKPYKDNLKLAELRTKFDIAFQNIKGFIDNNRNEFQGFEGYERKYDYNFFADRYDKNIDSCVTEMWFENSRIRGKGEVDLIRSPDKLLDYKTGSKKSASSIVESSIIDLLETEEDPDPNFQAILYLLHHREQYPDKKLEFFFYYFMNNMEDQMAGRTSREDNLVRVTYYPTSFNNKISDKEVYRFLNSANVRKKILKPLNQEQYKEIFNAIKIPKEAQFDKEEIVDSSLDKLKIEFKKYLEIGWGCDATENKLQESCESILKQLVEFRKSNYFKEDLDRFENFIEEQIQKLNNYKKQKDGNLRFPVKDIDLDNIAKDYKDLIIDE